MVGGQKEELDGPGRRRRHPPHSMTLVRSCPPPPLGEEGGLEASCNSLAPACGGGYYATPPPDRPTVRGSDAPLLHPRITAATRVQHSTHLRAATSSPDSSPNPNAALLLYTHVLSSAHGFSGL